MARICFVCISLRAGGTERIVTRMANALSFKHDVSVIIAHNSEPFYPLNDRVSFHPDQGWEPDRPKWKVAIAMARHVRAVVGQTQPDVILSFGELISPIARLATLGSRSAFIVFNRESPLRGIRGRSGMVNPLIYPMADCVVNQTAKAEQLMRRRYRFSRFRVLPNPVELPPSTPPVESRLKRIVSVGYLGGEKNQQALLHAFSGAQRRAGWLVSIVGDGPDKSTLQSLADQLGIESCLELPGELKDVPALLDNSSIFAFTSLSEGFPNALSEALAHGCACIAFDCVAGPSELIEHGVNGFLVQPGDNAEYARLLQRLIDEPELRVRFSCNAKESMQRFEAGAVMARLEKLIEEVVEGAPD